MMVINPKTPEDFTEVIEWAFDNGWTWRDGSMDIHQEYWSRPTTCIAFRDCDKTLTYCDRRYIIENFETKIFNMLQFHRFTMSYKVNNFGAKYDLR